jgi:hypothetical protein
MKERPGKTGFGNDERKEANPMRNDYEAPELTLVGEADEVVMGMGSGGEDFPMEAAWDFEFQQD